MSKIEKSTTYFEKGFNAIFTRYDAGTITYNQLLEDLIELQGHAEELNRKEIIQAFDMGFKLGVFWHIEITETKQNIARDHGVEYYRNIYEGGES